MNMTPSEAFSLGRIKGYREAVEDLLLLIETFRQTSLLMNREADLVLLARIEKQAKEHIRKTDFNKGVQPNE